MASLSSTIFLLLLALLLISATSAQNGLTLPIRKDAQTSQFYTTFQLGSRRAPIDAVVFLGGQHLWIACDGYSSATYAPVPCGSAKCELYGGVGCSGCSGPDRPGCTNNTCGASSWNPYGSTLTSQGFYEDTFLSEDDVRLPEFLFSCVLDDYKTGLAKRADGMLGMARVNTSVHKLAADKLNLPDKFSFCPPSGSGLGKLSIGVELSSKTNVAGLLKTTPLIINKPVSNLPFWSTSDPSEEYFIDVRSIRVAGAPLSVKPSYFAINKDRIGGTRISTDQKYTSLHTSIYKPLNRAFDKAAAGMKIKSAAAVAPFRACYSTESISRTRAAGPDVPAIDLVLPGSDVYWRISGANSMVEIDRKTMCLAFVDAGSRSTSSIPMASIVIGAHQLGDNLLEFDLVSSQLRFSSSLLVHNKSCSRI